MLDSVGRSHHISGGVWTRGAARRTKAKTTVLSWGCKQPPEAIGKAKGTLVTCTLARFHECPLELPPHLGRSSNANVGARPRRQRRSTRNGPMATAKPVAVAAVAKPAVAVAAVAKPAVAVAKPAVANLHPGLRKRAVHGAPAVFACRPPSLQRSPESLVQLPAAV